MTPMNDAELRRLFGVRLRFVRFALGYTARAFAVRLGVEENTLTGWERLGTMPESLFDLMRLADTLDVSLDYLVFGRTGGLSGHLREKLEDGSRRLAASEGVTQLGRGRPVKIAVPPEFEDRKACA